MWTPRPSEVPPAGRSSTHSRSTRFAFAVGRTPRLSTSGFGFYYCPLVSAALAFEKDLPTMPDTPPSIAATSVLTTVLSCAKPYNGRKAVSQVAAKGKRSQLATGKAKRAMKRAADPSGFESGMKHTIRKQTKAAEKRKRESTKVRSGLPLRPACARHHSHVPHCRAYRCRRPARPTRRVRSDARPGQLVVVSDACR